MIQKKHTLLHNLIGVETWLNDCSAQGYKLVRVRGNTFEFEHKSASKTRHTHYCFSYYWKGKKDQPITTANADHLGKAVLVPNCSLKVGLLTDVTVGLYSLDSRNDDTVDRFYQYHHYDHKRAVVHCWVYRGMLLCIALLIVICFFFL